MYGYPPQPPYGWPPYPPPQVGPQDIVSSIKQHEETIKTLKELLKDKKPEKKSWFDKDTKNSDMLKYMAIWAFPIGFLQIAAWLLFVRTVGKSAGLLP